MGTSCGVLVIWTQVGCGDLLYEIYLKNENEECNHCSNKIFIEKSKICCFHDRKQIYKDIFDNKNKFQS